MGHPELDTLVIRLCKLEVANQFLLFFLKFLCRYSVFVKLKFYPLSSHTSGVASQNRKHRLPSKSGPKLLKHSLLIPERSLSKALGVKTSCAKGDRQRAMSPAQSQGSEALGAPLLPLVGSPSKGDSSGAYRAQLRLKSLVALSSLVHVYSYDPSQCSGQSRRGNGLCLQYRVESLRSLYKPTHERDHHT